MAAINVAPIYYPEYTVYQIGHYIRPDDNRINVFCIRKVATSLYPNGHYKRGHYIRSTLYSYSQPFLSENYYITSSFEHFRLRRMGHIVPPATQGVYKGADHVTRERVMWRPYVSRDDGGQ